MVKRGQAAAAVFWRVREHGKENNVELQDPIGDRLDSLWFHDFFYEAKNACGLFSHYNFIF